MFIIRRSTIEDIPTLLKLAKMVHFINLPADKDIIAAKVAHSRNCFSSAASGAPRARPTRSTREMPGLADGGSELFMFTLEDTETGACLGTSQLVAAMGAPGNPQVALRLSERSFFSKSLQFGSTHVVAKLHLDESGPTEIGGLILQPSYRKHKARLGRLLSFVRFHFMGLYRDRFADRVIAEMMAPISADGVNTLWDYFGRRFINLSYTEADRFCQVSREFMTSLLPREEIYLTLLPPEARAVVGQVGAETVPARRMLEKLGFEYRNLVDPFDGGPYLEAATDKITLVADTRSATLDALGRARPDRRGIVSVLAADGEFRAIEADYREDEGTVRLSEDDLKLLQADPGAEGGVTPLEEASQARTPQRAEPARGQRRARSARS